MKSTDSAATPCPPRALVIVVRGLSPFFLGPYGNEWVHTSALDRFAARGVVFDQQYATDLTSSMADAFDEFPAKVIRIRANASATRRRHSLLDTRRMLYFELDRLDENTPALVIVETDALMSPWDPPKRFLNYYFGRSRADDAPQPWLDELPDTVNDDLTLERIQDTSAAVISCFDAGLARLLAGARRRGFGKDALIAITSDLAFPVGEQGIIGWKQPKIAESVVHLPLLLRLPGWAHAGLRIAALTQAGDFQQTLDSHFRREPAKGLWPLMHGEAESLHEHLLIEGNGENAVRTPDRLRIAPADGAPRLYVKPDDRWEMVDVAGKLDG